MKKLGIVYFIQPATLLYTNRFKIGWSSAGDFTRCKSYKKGTRYISVFECVNANEVESKIISGFKQKFHLFAGREYFEGDEEDMFAEFLKIVMQYREKTKQVEVVTDNKNHNDVSNVNDNLLNVSQPSNLVERNIINQKVFYKCIRCNYRTTRKSNMDNHMKRKQSCLGAEQPIEAVIDIPKKNTCSKCQTIFTTKHGLRIHIARCNGIHPLQCPRCKLMFSARQSKYLHMKTVKCCPNENSK
jgi:hypothetical protein